MHGANGLVSTAENRVDAFATSLKIACLDNEHTDEDIHFAEEVEEDYENEPEIGQLATTSPDEVRDIIKYVSAKKAPGRDKIVRSNTCR